MIRWSTEPKLRSSSGNSKPDNGPGPVAGLLIIDKPSGCTSHDVVARIRRWTRVPRVGHAGTLDPQATGVLLIGLGTGTKLTQFLHECPKTYRATLQLGVRTDTCDAAGKVVEVRPVHAMSQGQVEAVLGSFRGTIEQIPPMFSALKQQGQRLYTLARQGIDVDRQPRRVQIYRLVVLEFTGATLRLEVECSSGTYIRVLADDIGLRLGCGAHLSALVRTATGPFSLAQAHTLPAIGGRGAPTRLAAPRDFAVDSSGRLPSPDPHGCCGPRTGPRRCADAPRGCAPCGHICGRRYRGASWTRWSRARHGVDDLWCR